MKYHYQGYKYSFEVEAEPYKDKFFFSIIAIHKASGKFSCINTLNQILSEFSFNGNDPRASESDWLISKQEVNVFLHNVKELFLDKNSIRFLEDKLDEDRECGEWENKGLHVAR